MPLKNYTTDIPADRSVAEITKALRAFGVKGFSVEYEDGRIALLTFSIDLNGKRLAYALPARWRRVQAVLAEQRRKGARGGVKTDDETAYRVAWRNVRDWALAQIALLETQQAKVEEVFLPYMVTGRNETLFERLESGRFMLPPSGMRVEEE